LQNKQSLLKPQEMEFWFWPHELHSTPDSEVGETKQKGNKLTQAELEVHHLQYAELHSLESLELQVSQLSSIFAQVWNSSQYLQFGTVVMKQE